MRVNVHLPDDLHGRVKAHPEINVSRVCQAALAHEVRVREAIAEANVDDAKTAERLAHSRVQEVNEDFERGLRAGLDWAKTTATWAELSFLAQFDGKFLFRDLEDGHSLTWYLFRQAQGDGYDDAEPDMFKTLRENPYDRGLVHGAAEVFRAVEKVVPDPEDPV